MNRPSWRAAILFLAAASLAFFASYWKVLPLFAVRQARSSETKPPEPEVRTLVLKQGVANPVTLAGGQTHAYSLKLEKGQFVDLVVEQQGIDVVLKLYTPAGELETTVDSPSGAEGTEVVPILALTDEPQELEIGAASPSAVTGHYVLRVVAARLATPADALRVRAERALARGECLRRDSIPERLQEAVQLERHAREDFHSLGHPAREAETLFSLGRLYELRSERTAAISAYKEALLLFRQLRRVPEEANSLIALGENERLLGHSSDARRYLEDALPLAAQLGRRDIALIQYSLGKLHADVGDIEKAFDLLEQAREGFRAAGNNTDLAVLLALIGDLYFRRGQFERAIDAYSEAADLLASQGDAQEHAVQEHAVFVAKLGGAYSQSNDLPQARSFLEKALAIQERRSPPADQAATLNQLALVLEKLGEVPLAIERFSRSVRLFREQADTKSEAIVLANLAYLQLQQGDSEAGERSYERAFELFGRADEAAAGEASARYYYARTLAARGEPRKALESMSRVLDLIERIRTETASHSLRASAFAFQQPALAFHVELLMTLHSMDPTAGHEVLAFEAYESSRARALLDDLVVSAADLRLGGRVELLEQEALVDQRIASTQADRLRLLAGAPAADDHLDELARQLRFDLGEADRIEAKLRTAHPRFEESLQAKPLTLTEIQRTLLDEDAVLLEYFLGEAKSFLWVVSGETVTTFELPPRKQIEDAAARLHQALASGDQILAQGEVERGLQRLSATLLGPASGMLGRRELIVIPDGDLALVPFAALPFPDGGPDEQSRNRRYLGASHEITYGPSASALVSLCRRGQRRESATGLLAAVGDAIFEADDERLGALARRRVRPKLNLAEVLGLHRLRYSSEELRAILRLAPEGSALSLTGFQAQRDAVLTGRLGSYRILHFATHALFDPEFPELSSIVLSTIASDRRPQDGFVRGYELRRLRLPADLVVLSACQTALGRRVRGEGVIGLASSLFSAGARQVLVSLWKVDDLATSRLMQRFYLEFLEERRSPAAALRLAQASLADDPRWRSPYYWAGFVLQGDAGSR